MEQDVKVNNPAWNPRDNTVQVKERPILFSTPMVKAIIEGRKTVTRRIIDPQPRPCQHELYIDADWKDQSTNWEYFKDNPDEWYCTYCGNGVDFHGNGMKCRFGAVGDILWVRETWRPFLKGSDTAPGYWNMFEFLAGGDKLCPLEYELKFDDYLIDGKWKPSIHMPRAACRLRLEIKSIRVERLHDITEDECFREGIDADDPDYCEAEHASLGGVPIAAGGPARHAFICLWSRINGAESWNSNPWVWRIEFKKIKG